MSYVEAIQFLYQLQVFGMKLGLENVFRLAALAGNPHERLRFIHVAGTNGKGSTCAMLESIYRHAGLRVGLFTSPHLVSFAERLQVNRELIAETEVARLVEEMRGLIERGDFRPSPTFFEVVTVMALQHFARQRCDLVIWETGLGGRLDATNIVTPLACAITNIQLDHQQWLGETSVEIAREKAGIIKCGVPVITAATDTAALKVIGEMAHTQKAPLLIVGELETESAKAYELGLLGDHQHVNAAVALAVVRALQEPIPVAETAIRAGLKNVRWAGRLQVVERAGGQIVLLDGAHNPAGAQALAATLPGLRPAGSKRRPALILGAMRDKDCAAICQILAPLADNIFLARVGSERAADPALLAEYCRLANPQAKVVACENLAGALARIAEEEFVVITGSLYFIGEALEWLGLGAPGGERALNDYATTVAAVGKPPPSNPNPP